MPRVILPVDFEDYLNVTSGQGGSPVIKSGNGTLSIIGPNGRDKATIYIGAIFDGDRTFENFTSALPSVQVKFYAPPVINSSSEVIEFNPRLQTFIEIHVRNFLQIVQDCENCRSIVSFNSDRLTTTTSRFNKHAQRALRANRVHA